MKQNNNNVSDFPDKTGSVDGPETGRDWNHYQVWNLAYWDHFESPTTTKTVVCRLFDVYDRSCAYI